MKLSTISTSEKQFTLSGLLMKRVQFNLLCLVGLSHLIFLKCLYSRALVPKPVLLDNQRRLLVFAFTGSCFLNLLGFNAVFRVIFNHGFSNLWVLKMVHFLFAVLVIVFSRIVNCKVYITS